MRQQIEIVGQKQQVGQKIYTYAAMAFFCRFTSSSAEIQSSIS